MSCYVLNFEEIDQTQVARRWRQGGAFRGALADRRHPGAAGLLRDDGRLPADPGADAVDRRSARSARSARAGRQSGDPGAQRGDSPGSRRDRHSDGSGVGDHAPAGRTRRARRLRHPIQRDNRGLAVCIVRGPARLVSEHRGPGRDPPTRRAGAGPRSLPNEP